MKMKRLVSAIAALAMSVSAFAGIASADTVKWAPTAADLVALTDWTVTADGDWVTPSGYANRASAVAALPTAVTDGVVQIKFDTKHAAFGGGVVFQDSNGNEIVKASFDNGSWAFTINGVTPSIGFSRGNVVDVDLTVDMTAKTIVSGTVTNETNGTVDSTSLAGVAFTSAAAADIGKIALSPRGGNFAANGNVSVANVSLTALTVSTAAYTINYTLGDTVVKTTTDSAIVGQTVNAETVVYDEAGAKYFAEAASLEVTADAAANVLNVPVEAADSYSVTIDAVGAIEQNLFTGTAVEGDDYSYSYPAYIEAEGVFYKAEGTTFGETVTAINAAIDKDVTYTVAEDVVAFIEGEDAAKTGGSANLPTKATLSGGMAQSIQRSTKEALTFTFNAPVDGKYKIYAALYNADSKERKYDLHIDDAEYATVLATGALASGAEGVIEYEVDLTAGEHTVYYAINYSLTPAVDYLVVSLIEEAVTPELTLPEVTVATGTDYTENTGNPARTYTGTFTVGENNVAVSGVLWTVGEKTATSTFDTVISSGTVVTGLVVVAADLEAIPAPVATAVAAE